VRDPAIVGSGSVGGGGEGGGASDGCGGRGPGPAAAGSAAPAAPAGRPRLRGASTIPWAESSIRLIRSALLPLTLSPFALQTALSSYTRRSTKFFAAIAGAAVRARSGAPRSSGGAARCRGACSASASVNKIIANRQVASGFS